MPVSPGTPERAAIARRYRQANAERIRDTQRKYRAANVEKLEASRLAYSIKIYGMTPDDFHAMELSQGGVCAICGSLPGPKKIKQAERQRRVSRLHVDHCHTTGKIRGLLCGNCNRGVGQMMDSPLILRAAARYLECS